MSHLESGRCSSGLTRRHLNGLVAEHAGSAAILVKDYTLFFLAGPPKRHSVHTNPDSTARIWSCLLCKKSFSTRRQLTTHCGRVGCLEAYPQVLQCPESACTEAFKTFSSLLQHLEMQHDQHLKEGPVADTLQYLKDHLGDSFVKERLGRIEFDMKFNSGKLSLTTVTKDESLSQP